MTFPVTEPRDAATGDAHRFRRHYAIQSFNAKDKSIHHARDDV